MSYTPEPPRLTPGNIMFIALVLYLLYTVFTISFPQWPYSPAFRESLRHP